MAINTISQAIEIEVLTGIKTNQALLRAEAPVQSAGRDAIEPLLADASIRLEPAEAQTDRVLAEGDMSCQAVYRQGDETTLRTLTATARVSQVFDMPGVMQGDSVNVCASVEHVDVRYENGHMVFLVTVSIRAQAFRLVPASVITGVEGCEGCGGIETISREICSVKTIADTQSSAFIRQEVSLPAAIDARTALLDHAVAVVDSYEADLGGVRVKGRCFVDVLIGSGVEGRPAAAVKYAPEFEQLVEAPEWLTQDVCVEVDVRSIDTRVEHPDDTDDSLLVIEGEIGICVMSRGKDCANAITDLYSVSGVDISPQTESIKVCTEISCVTCEEQVKGTLLLNQNAPGVGSVISIIARPNISGWGTNGESVIDGVIEASILYMPGGSDTIASTSSEMPFSIKCATPLNDTSRVCVSVINAEANALMSDRVEMRCTLTVNTETYSYEDIEIVTEIDEGEPIRKRPGIILYWSTNQDTPWTIARRYKIPATQIPAIVPNKPLILSL